MIIEHYIYNPIDDDDDVWLPSGLKIFRINRCLFSLTINTYPPGLEHLDIPIQVDISILPPTLKSVGLYGFNLEENEIELPENITTIYTEDHHIKYVPPHITKVIVIYKAPADSSSLGYDVSIRMGKVLFRIVEDIPDDCFLI